MSPPLSPCHGFGEADTRRMEEQKRTSDLLASGLDTIRPYNYITVNLSSISDSSEGEGEGVGEGEGDDGRGDKPVTPRQVTSKPQIGTGSSSRPKIFLLDEMPSKAMGSAKLPTTKAVMLAEFSYLLDMEEAERKAHSNKDTVATGAAVRESSRQVSNDVLDIWRLHFGGNNGVLIEGEKRIVISHKNIMDKIVKLYNRWKDLERESRTDRMSSRKYQQKVEEFKEELEKPFDIRNQRWLERLTTSGIKEYQSDIQHLENQMKRVQVGCISSIDSRQWKRDERKRKQEEAAARKKEKEEKKSRETECLDSDSEEDTTEVNCNDPVFVPQLKESEKKRKVDVMGPSATCGMGRGISVRDRTAYAAEVAKALGVDVNDTNISRSSCHYQDKKVRKSKAAEVRQEFKENKSQHLSLHVDGKMLSELGSRKSCNRIAVVLRNIGPGSQDHIVAIPKSVSGSGQAEANVTIEALKEEEIREEVKVIVFDTTSSNTSPIKGMVYFIEDYIDTGILQCGCRHHCSELICGKMWELIFGETSSPKVAIFEKFQKDFEFINIDYKNLSKLDISSLPEWLQEECRSVLSWALDHLEKATFPRGDYKELLQLLIIYLGGSVESFR